MVFPAGYPKGDIGEPLTEDENRMMALLATGAKVGRIASELGYEVSTIHHRLKTIEKKLGQPNRIAAMAAWCLLQPRHVAIPRQRRCGGVVAVRDSSGATVYVVCKNVLPCIGEHAPGGEPYGSTRS